MSTRVYQLFSKRARDVFGRANQEAQRANHESIQSEDVLLGLIAETGGGAAHVFRKLGVDLHAIRREIEKLVNYGPEAFTAAKLPLYPGARHVLEFSIEEAMTLNHNYVGTEHLLAGLIRDGNGIASRVLTNTGLSLEAVRQEMCILPADMKDR